MEGSYSAGSLKMKSCLKAGVLVVYCLLGFSIELIYTTQNILANVTAKAMVLDSLNPSLKTGFKTVFCLLSRYVQF